MQTWFDMMKNRKSDLFRCNNNKNIFTVQDSKPNMWITSHRCDLRGRCTVPVDMTTARSRHRFKAQWMKDGPSKVRRKQASWGSPLKLKMRVEDGSCRCWCSRFKASKSTGGPAATDKVTINTGGQTSRTQTAFPTRSHVYLLRPTLHRHRDRLACI